MTPVPSHLLRLVAALLLCAGSSPRGEFCLSVLPIANYTTLKSEFSDLHSKLLRKLEHEFMGQRIRSVVKADKDSSTCEYYISGTIDSSMQGYILILNIGDYTMSEGESKVIPIEGKNIDELLDLIVVRIRYFIEHSLLSTVSVSSNPLGCDVAVNGKKSGKTPTELLLKPGQYAINVSNRYFQPFNDSIFVTPRQRADIKAEMVFRGSNVTGWVITASVFSALTIGAAAAEYKFHKDYLNVPRFCDESQAGGDYERCSQEEYNAGFNRYRLAGYAAIGLAGASGITLSISGFNFFRNKSVKKSLYFNVLPK
jgi:hypothetical protein